MTEFNGSQFIAENPETSPRLQEKKRVIAISGMPGAGKSAASGAAKQMGLSVLVLGDVIREETRRRGLEPTPQNVGSVMLEVRRTEGPAVVAKRLVPKIDASASGTVVVEGVRSEDELRELQTRFDVKTFAIHASPQTRFQRLLTRGRSDDPKNWDAFQERDNRELSVGLCKVIALAHVLLTNEETIDDLQSSFRAAVNKLKLQ